MLLPAAQTRVVAAEDRAVAIEQLAAASPRRGETCVALKALDGGYTGRAASAVQLGEALIPPYSDAAPQLALLLRAQRPPCSTSLVIGESRPLSDLAPRGGHSAQLVGVRRLPSEPLTRGM